MSRENCIFLYDGMVTAMMKRIEILEKPERFTQDRRRSGSAVTVHVAKKFLHIPRKLLSYIGFVEPFERRGISWSYSGFEKKLKRIHKGGICLVPVSAEKWKYYFSHI